MSLYEYLQILRARWVVIVATALAAVLAAVAVAALSTPQYRASTRVLFGFSGPAQTGQLSRTFTYTSAMVQSYARVVALPVVLDPVIEDLALDTDAVHLAEHVSATADLDSLILRINVTDADPARAAKISNAVATRLVATVDDLNPARTVPTPTPTPSAGPGTPSEAETTGARLRGQIVSQAVPPRSPIWPRTGLMIGVGLGLGLIAGVMLAVTLAVVNRRLIGRSEVSAVTKLPVLGAAPRATSGARRLVGWLRQGGHQPRERIHELGANIIALTAGSQVRTVAFTSAYDDRATITTVDELGRILARVGHRVLLVDTDLRGATTGKSNGVAGGSADPPSEGRVGLTEVLAGKATWQQAVRRARAREPFILPAGQEDLGPDALTSPAISDLLAGVRQQFDVVLVKTAPALRAADGLLVSALTDGVIVVTDDASMSRELLVDVLDSLDAVGAQPMGVVLSA